MEKDRLAGRGEDRLQVAADLCEDVVASPRQQVAEALITT